MREEQIPQLRLELLSILDAVHDACVKNKIRYYLVAGTALGAVRHKGFIPWDTDIDIAMERDDYERFLRMADQILDPLFFCGNYHNTIPWYHTHALVYKKDTCIHWSDYSNRHTCPIYIDLFALDRVPDDVYEREAFEHIVRRMMYILGRKECIIYRHNNILQRFAKRLYASGISTIYPGNRYNDAFEKEIQHYNSFNYQKKGILTSPYSFAKECIDDDIIGNPTLYEFEGKRYYGYERMDDYLTQLYGDYMVLPPIEERTFNLDLLDHIEWSK